MRPPLEDRRIATVAWIACFGSIWTMLGHTAGIAPFWVLGWALLAPSLAIVAGAWWLAARRGHTELALAMRIGVWGGVWGTVGYDLVRIPLHLLGMNPFAPIRSYGLYLANAPSATTLTDWLGALYHFSNGITFGILYVLIMRGRNLWWGVLWGLVLEALAIVLPFGEVYGVRHAPMVMFVAFFAHVYYGLPLGGAARNPEETRALLDGPHRGRVLGATVLATAAVIAFLTFAWEGPGSTPPPRVLEVGPDALRSGWTRVQVGEPLALRSRADAEIRLVFPKDGRAVDLAPGGDHALIFDEPGIYQVVAPTTGWRSAFVSVERGPYPR